MSHYFSIGSSRNKVEPYDNMPERENLSVSQTSSERTKQLKKSGLSTHTDRSLPIKTVGKAGKPEEWNCVSLSYPLEKIIKGFCFFGIIRAVFDTIIAISNLVFIMGLKYKEVSLSATPPANDTLLEITEVARIKFDSSKNLLAYALGAACLLYFSEVPMTAYLISSMRSRKKSQLILYIQVAVLIIISNWILNIAFVVYFAKAGIIRNDKLVSRVGNGEDASERKYFRTTSYCLVFRIAMYDLTKFAELVFVQAFMNENKRKVTWGPEQFSE